MRLLFTEPIKMVENDQNKLKPNSEKALKTKKIILRTTKYRSH